MFDIGWSEMAVILLVALVVIGPRDLPRVARTLGRWVAKGRAMAREFQSALEDMAREAELDKVKSEIEKAGRTNLGKSIENTIDPTGELGKAFDPNAEERREERQGRTGEAGRRQAGRQAGGQPVAAEPPLGHGRRPSRDAGPPPRRPPGHCGGCAGGSAGPPRTGRTRLPTTAAGRKRPSPRPFRPIPTRWR